ncbi:uncharacterized protein BT62DRAFT_1075854 [Guyanagaster necrorhizus]|uniref:Uncharacterized protein n=1 Tax=Guyanagaster necrorhizus TaxID=856835 RepID=A0A9P7VRT6_9AGAR|nr:uncharacterized protein BT62DRAFT_1075854 [Guyanagaster necrorhizus MCA 3950]KAG7446266.1 hypothetical protein BT62DRAFT_1075854 [Guyanagaster necrorhizus MCA 3950]
MLQVPSSALVLESFAASNGTYVPSIASAMSPSFLPRLIWDLYLEYLWYYSPNSWVACIAYGFRIIAIFLVSPIVIITLLDLASYGVARTLGIVDAVKASTSDSASAGLNAPALNVDDVTPLDSLDTSSPHAYFTSDENKLSGVDGLSPVVSRATSPTITRRQLPEEEARVISGDAGGDEVHLRRRQNQAEDTE